MAQRPGFFDAADRLQASLVAGDPLERLRAVVDFELFCSELETARASASKQGSDSLSVQLEIGS